MINSREKCLTTILFHRFFFNEEPVERGRDRLKRQCEWLRKNYTPMTLKAATKGLRIGCFPKRSLLVTIDDALVDILDVKDIFESFELPITIFVCVGWCADASSADLNDDTLLACIVNMFEWYEGPDREVDIDHGRLKLKLCRAQRDRVIDLILANQKELRPHFGHILAQLYKVTNRNGKRIVCTWDELTDLKVSGADIGCHSISHVNLGNASPTRMAFEITEARRILEAKFRECAAFAYPYGCPGTFNDSTTAALNNAGFHFAFLTHSDFAGGDTDPYHLPRIALPDRSMSHVEFCARVAGSGVAYRKARELLRGDWLSSY
jgi:peptidoglycan/xylan/chitin deacetylase (PgdA/CDA1 family)